MGIPVCPYIVGKTYFRPMHQPEKVQVACPVCNGNKQVEVILGDGEHLFVPCEACGLGFERSRGYIEQYQYRPRAVPFTLASIEAFDREQWTLKSELGEQIYSTSLYESEEEAFLDSKQQSDKQQEQNARSFSQTKQSAKKVTWSIRYHRECIKDLERKISYHVGAIAAREAADEVRA